MRESISGLSFQLLVRRGERTRCSRGRDDCGQRTIVSARSGWIAVVVDLVQEDLQTFLVGSSRACLRRGPIGCERCLGQTPQRADGDVAIAAGTGGSGAG